MLGFNQNYHTDGAIRFWIVWPAALDTCSRHRCSHHHSTTKDRRQQWMGYVTKAITWPPTICGVRLIYKTPRYSSKKIPNQFLRESSETNRIVISTFFFLFILNLIGFIFKMHFLRTQNSSATNTQHNNCWEWQHNNIEQSIEWWRQQPSWCHLRQSIVAGNESAGRCVQPRRNRSSQHVRETSCRPGRQRNGNLSTE